MNLKIYEKTKYQNIYRNKTKGTYTVMLDLGYINGSRRKTSQSGFEKIQDAKDFLMNSENINKVTYDFKGNYLFKDLLSEYFEYMEKVEKLKLETVRRKRKRFDFHMNFFYEKKISKITVKDISLWHEYLNSYKKEDGTLLSADTKNTMHKQLSSYFNWLLLKKKVINSNPCSEIKNFKIPKRKIEYRTLEEINQVFDTIDNSSMYPKNIRLLIKAILKLFFFDGFRTGEEFGLKFIDFSFDLINCDLNEEEIIKISINRTVYYTTGGWIITDGKTYDSLREIYVNSNVLKPLIEYIRCMQRMGVKYEPNDFIFTNPKNSKIYSQEYLRKIINRYFDEAGVPRVKLKDLRHSYATFLLSNGYRLEDIKDALGHTNVKTTERYYATIYEENKAKMAADIGKYA